MNNYQIGNNQMSALKDAGAAAGKLFGMFA
jgi:hypothetical protein